MLRITQGESNAVWSLKAHHQMHERTNWINKKMVYEKEVHIQANEIMRKLQRKELERKFFISPLFFVLYKQIYSWGPHALRMLCATTKNRSRLLDKLRQLELFLPLSVATRACWKDSRRNIELWEGEKFFSSLHQVDYSENMNFCLVRLNLLSRVLIHFSRSSFNFHRSLYPHIQCCWVELLMMNWTLEWRNDEVALNGLMKKFSLHHTHLWVFEDEKKSSRWRWRMNGS